MNSETFPDVYFDDYFFDGLDVDFSDYDYENEVSAATNSNTHLDPTFTSDAYLFEFIVEACSYFSSLGYICNPGEVFQVVNSLGGSMVDIKNLLSTMLVHSQSENDAFDEIFKNFVHVFFYRQKQTREEKMKFERNARSIQERIDACKNKQKRLLASRAQVNPAIEKAEKTEEKQSKIKNLQTCLNGCKTLKNFVDEIKKNKKPNHQKLMDEIKKAATAAMKFSNSAEIMKAIKERGKQLESIKEDSINQQIEIARRDEEALNKKLEQEEARFNARMDEILKEQSSVHRPEFNSATVHNSVRSRYTGEIVLDKEFNKMTDEEKRKIADYIRDNARKFRTRLSRKIRAKNANKIDVKATVKKSCQTDGIPLRLVHERPIRQKTNLVMILDVSGSCKNASEMMLVFMHAMKSVFPGGCHTYVFTNVLYDVSEFFDTDDAEEAAHAILDAIPRAGAYSNYERPFHTMYDKHLSDVTGDSYVYIIGDARNNKNPSGVDYIKAIARKAKKAFWLNTDNVNKWDQGDSIISTYAPYMTRVVQTTTPAELLGFLEG